MEVVENFAKEGIPLSVAVIDMDWHITEVDERYGSGWTGYTWNKELFPDYKRFLKRLHDNKLAVTLNLKGMFEGFVGPYYSSRIVKKSIRNLQLP